MKKIAVVMTGLLGLAASWAQAESFEQQTQQISRQISGAVRQAREDSASKPPVVMVWNPADALDETKAGLAAKFVPIEPGKFMMGSPKDEKGRGSDETQHLVKLTKGFEMQATPVTQLQYFLVMGGNPAHFKRRENCDAGKFKKLAGVDLCADHPVENVNRGDALALIHRLNGIQNKYQYRLPTEAEWEYAARAGTPSSFPYSFGSNDKNELENHAWYDKNYSGATHAVATKKANPYGLYDMNGNVWQWVSGWYGDYPAAAVQDPAGPPTGSYGLVRGGSYHDAARKLRSAFRGVGGPGSPRYDQGFRLVRTSR